jgi:ferritin-like metal-binding protein YciE
VSRQSGTQHAYVHTGITKLGVADLDLIRSEGKTFMSLAAPRDLLIHELGDMLSAENIIAKMLPELAKEAQQTDIRDAFKEHERETKEQIKRLQAAFKELGEKPENTTCFATEGLKQEHTSLHEEDPTPQVLEIANLLGAAKTEHYEIASYTGLVQLAKDLGEPAVAELLKQNLDEETAMAKKLTAFSKAMGKGLKTTSKTPATA